MKRYALIFGAVLTVFVVGFVVFLQFYSFTQISKDNYGMYPTLTPGEYLIVQLKNLSLQAGDIVLVSPTQDVPYGEWISRVVTMDENEITVQGDSEQSQKVTISSNNVKGKIVARYRKCVDTRCSLVWEGGL